MTTNIRITIEHDIDTENPADYDHEWKPISFVSKFINHEDPEQYIKFEDGKIVPATKELKEKFEKGFAYLLDYYEHGLGLWSIHGHGPSCEWDNSSVAGILVWNHKDEDMGADTPETRMEDAKRFLSRYSDWCNGTCHYFEVHEIEECSHCGHEVTKEIEVEGARQGHIGDDIEDGIEQALYGLLLGDYPDIEIEYAGQGSWYGDHVKVPTPDDLAQARQRFAEIKA